MQTQYETEKKEQTIKAQSQKLAVEQSTNRAYIIAIIAIVSVLVILFMMYRSSKKISRVLRKQRDEIAKQKEELEVLNLTKDKFFSIIAHDLRSPMVALQGVGNKLDYYIRKDLKDKMISLGDKIDSSIENLTHLLNNLLLWASSQSHGLNLHPTQMLVKDIVDETVDLYRSLATSKGISFEVKTTSDTIYADYNTVMTIVRNVVSNAIKFSPQDSVVSITTNRMQTNTIIVVEDEGDGFDESQKVEILSGNIQSMKGTKGEDGFGLGLSLCKEFVELNSGELLIGSNNRGGASITISLPSLKTQNKAA